MSDATEKPGRFRLSLEVDEGGKRRFQDSWEFPLHEEIDCSAGESIATAMKACFESGNHVLWHVMSAMDERGMVHGLGYALHELWTGERKYEDAISVTIDIDKLMLESSAERKDEAARVLERHGVTVTRSG